jgi:NAD(P)-dependent dehydrogenase (short-subunit alcohol dehydrogenase family)
MSPTSATDIVLITGANQGIGFETAKKLASEQKGYHIIMSGRRKEAIEAAAQELQKKGLSVEALVMDVTSDESIASAVKAVEAVHGRLDVLINNAGIAVDGDCANDRASWIRVYNTNVFGVAAVTDAFIPLLEKSKTTKRVIFVSTPLASFEMRLDKNGIGHGWNGWRVYSSSKSALNMVAVHYIVRFENDASWKFLVDAPPHCATNLNAFAGANPVEQGAINCSRLATLGADGETGTFSSNYGTIPW